MSGVVGKLFSSEKAKPIEPITPPKVAEASKDEKLARTGRASLIATSAQGILGQAQTGRKKLSV